MLEWLNEWLKSIIIIILLAAFVDLILPNRSMQRYVKFVVSLFVLMTILTPIVKIIVSDFDWNKIEFPNTPIDSIVASVTPLDQIERDGQRMREEQNKQAMAIVKSQVEELIADQIKQKVGTSPHDVSASLTQNEEGEARIERIEIEWSLDQFGKEPDRMFPEQRSSSQTKLVEPVKPVQIDAVSKVSDQRDQNEHQHENAELQDPKANDRISELEQQITQMLQREWELEGSQIRFRYID